jgi:hypothetical protein
MNNHQSYLHNRPTGNKEELEAFATETMHSFFNDYDLNECHYNLWLMMKQCIFVKHWQLCKEERAQMVNFYESFHKLILASSILYNSRENGEHAK